MFETSNWTSVLLRQKVSPDRYGQVPTSVAKRIAHLVWHICQRPATSRSSAGCATSTTRPLVCRWCQKLFGQWTNLSGRTWTPGCGANSWKAARVCSNISTFIETLHLVRQYRNVHVCGRATEIFKIFTSPPPQKIDNGQRKKTQCSSSFRSGMLRSVDPQLVLKALWAATGDLRCLQRVLFWFCIGLFLDFSPNSVSHWGVLTVRVKPLRSRCFFLSASFFTAQGHRKRDSGGQNLRFACAKPWLGIFFCVSL